MSPLLVPRSGATRRIPLREHERCTDWSAGPSPYAFSARWVRSGSSSGRSIRGRQPELVRACEGGHFPSLEETGPSQTWGFLSRVARQQGPCCHGGANTPGRRPETLEGHWRWRAARIRTIGPVGVLRPGRAVGRGPGAQATARRSGPNRAGSSRPNSRSIGDRSWGAGMRGDEPSSPDPDGGAVSIALMCRRQRPHVGDREVEIDRRRLLDPPQSLPAADDTPPPVVAERQDIRSRTHATTSALGRACLSVPNASVRRAQFVPFALRYGLPSPECASSIVTTMVRPYQTPGVEQRARSRTSARTTEQRPVDPSSMPDRSSIGPFCDRDPAATYFP